jgi:predicted DCC family thiol-disulfide oxidoreductase YuxK
MDETHDGARLIVLYDGVCGLCDRLVQFILRRDRRDRFRFAPLQGAFAARLLERHRRATGDLSTLYVVIDAGGPRERLVWKSRAILRILGEIGGAWRLATVLGLLPTRLLDTAYDVVASNRYRLFGRYETCALPSREQRSKFLDG